MFERENPEVNELFAIRVEAANETLRDMCLAVKFVSAQHEQDLQAAEIWTYPPYLRELYLLQNSVNRNAFCESVKRGLAMNIKLFYSGKLMDILCGKVLEPATTARFIFLETETISISLNYRDLFETKDDLPYVVGQSVKAGLEFVLSYLSGSVELRIFTKDEVLAMGFDLLRNDDGSEDCLLETRIPGVRFCLRYNSNDENGSCYVLIDPI